MPKGGLEDKLAQLEELREVVDVLADSIRIQQDSIEALARSVAVLSQQIMED